MKVLSGTKREVTLMQWKEVVDKYTTRANDSAKCFQNFGDISSLEMLIEDCEKLLENAKNAKKAIEFMNAHGTK